MLFILHICTSKKQSIPFRVFTLVASVLVMASTLLIKQHVFIDLISGDIIATMVFIVINYENKLTKKDNSKNIELSFIFFTIH